MERAHVWTAVSEEVELANGVEGEDWENKISFTCSLNVTPPQSYPGKRAFLYVDTYFEVMQELIFSVSSYIMKTF